MSESYKEEVKNFIVENVPLDSKILDVGKDQSKSDRAFVLYCTENYLDVVTMCAKSIRRYSEIPILVYLINSDKKINVDDVTVIRWDCDIDQPNENSYLSVDGNFYIVSVFCVLSISVFFI